MNFLLNFLLFRVLLVLGKHAIKNTLISHFLHYLFHFGDLLKKCLHFFRAVYFLILRLLSCFSFGINFLLHSVFVDLSSEHFGFLLFVNPVALPHSVFVFGVIRNLAAPIVFFLFFLRHLLLSSDFFRALAWLLTLALGVQSRLELSATNSMLIEEIKHLSDLMKLVRVCSGDDKLTRRLSFNMNNSWNLLEMGPERVRHCTFISVQVNHV